MTRGSPVSHVCSQLLGIYVRRARYPYKQPYHTAAAVPHLGRDYVAEVPQSCIWNVGHLLLKVGFQC